jgi:hypothetical protein
LAERKNGQLQVKLNPVLILNPLCNVWDLGILPENISTKNFQVEIEAYF